MSGAPWPAEDDDRLATLWAEGVSGRLIGAEMGRSKSSVIARAKRLGLRGRASPLFNGATAGHGWQGPRKPGTPPRKARKPPEPPAPKGPRFWIVPAGGERGERGCQWPSGERFNVTFCGAPAARDRPYCRDHCRIAYVGYRSTSPAAMAAAS